MRGVAHAVQRMRCSGKQCRTAAAMLAGGLSRQQVRGNVTDLVDAGERHGHAHFFFE